MTKRLLFAAVAASLVFPMFGVAPFEKGKTPPRQFKVNRTLPTRGAETNLLYEDFSKFTGGTEDEPGDEISYVDRYHIPDDLTSTPGWTGGGIFPAAGSIALKDREGLGKLGFISTPQFDMYGTVTLTFRARMLPGSDNGSLWIALCDDFYGPGDDQEDFDLTADWKEYTMIATHASDQDPSYFQIQAENGYVQLDDIKIDFKRDKIREPYPLNAINNSPTEFVARWEGTGAPLYLLTVYCKEKPVDIESGVIVEGFDGIRVNDDGKTIFSSDPCYPEGWEIDLSSNGKQDISVEEGTFNSAPQSLFFDAVGDVIVSPETPQPIDELKFWVRPSTMDEDPEVLSLLRVEVYRSLTGKWDALAQVPYYWMTEKGGYYVIDEKALGDDAVRARISMIQRGNIDFYVDDVTLSYSTRGETYKYLDDLEVKETQYTVSGINPENEYSYYVKAKDGDMVSSPSYLIWVDGIVGLKPEVLDATDMAWDSFTANWLQLGHATDYRVETNFIIKAETDMQGVVVNEESFDAITDTNMDWISPYNFADNGMAKTGWCATQPQWKPGMAGTQGTSWIGTAGLVFSPYMNLSCNGNEGFDVEATVETTVASVADGEGNEYREGIYVMALNAYTDTQAMCWGYFEAPEVGVHTAKVHVPNPDGVDLTNVIVAFMNVTGTAFFVDDVKITQDLRAGEQLMAPYSMGLTKDTSLKVEGLQAGRDHSYTVTAWAVHDYENFISDKSDVVTVGTYSVGVETVGDSKGRFAVATGKGTLSVAASEDVAFAVFGSNGIKVAEGKGSMSVALPAGIYIVKAGAMTRKVAVR